MLAWESVDVWHLTVKKTTTPVTAVYRGKGQINNGNTLTRKRLELMGLTSQEKALWSRPPRPLRSEGHELTTIQIGQ